MIPVEEGIKFTIQSLPIVFTVHKVTDDIVQVTAEGEMTEYTRKDFKLINNKKLKIIPNDNINI